MYIVTKNYVSQDNHVGERNRWKHFRALISNLRIHIFPFFICQTRGYVGRKMGTDSGLYPARGNKKNTFFQNFGSTTEISGYNVVFVSQFRTFTGDKT